MRSCSAVNIEFIFETLFTLHMVQIDDLKIVYEKMFQISLGRKLKELAKKKNVKIKYGEHITWMGKECRKLIAEIVQHLDADGHNEPIRALKKVN